MKANKDFGTPIKDRLVVGAAKMVLDRATIKNAIYQHSVLCQTFLPYRDPGKDITEWEQKQGYAHLAIQTSKQKNPHTGEFEYIGLPYGTKARLIINYLNSEAVKTQKRTINVGETMSSFLRELNISKTGPRIAEVKEQLRRINAATIGIYWKQDNTYITQQTRIVSAFEVSFQKNDQQRVLWDSCIQLSQDYFESLINHAVPMDERALINLSHSALAMDIYAWLSQKLHRIPWDKPVFVDWVSLKNQFGHNYVELRYFRKDFKTAFQQAMTQYPRARVSMDKTGLKLLNSEPPIPAKITLSIKP